MGPISANATAGDSTEPTATTSNISPRETMVVAILR
jgi:hypothetical protein